MADQGSERDVVQNLLDELAAMGPLSTNKRAFRSVFEAFDKGDARAFQAALKRARLWPRCHLVCEWLRIKWAVLHCIRLCGPPEEITRPDPRRFAEAVARVTTNEKLVTQLVDIIEKGDRAAFRRFVQQHRLGAFCHVFCHWVYLIRYRLVCRWICQPEIQRERPNLAAELNAHGHALRLLLKNGFDEAAAASEAGNAPKFRAAIENAGLLPYCRIVCEFFCTWRCVLICLPLCRQFPIARLGDPVEEAFAFAQATQALRKRPAELERLNAAIAKGDPEAFGAIVQRLELGRFCIQLCHWICFRRCRLFCELICPEPDTIPMFTHVGQYRVDPIYGDYQSDGTTTAGRFAFTRTIPLIGILPDGQAMEAVEYRFRVAKHPGLAPVQDVVASMVTPTKIGQLQYWYWNGIFWTLGSADYWVNNPGAQATIPQSIGPPLVVSVNKDVKPGGWIEVPRENNLTIGGVGRYVRSAEGLVNLNTRQFTLEQFDLRTPAPGLKAGGNVPAGKRSTKPTYRIFFEARKVLGGAPVNSNELDTIAFSNTEYTYTRHPLWAGGDVMTKEVCSLDIDEFYAPGASGCDKLANDLHALFTAYHPYLAKVRIWFEGEAPMPAEINPPIGAGHAASGAAGHHFNITGLQPCAYILWLETTVNLTSGSGQIGDATETDHIAFCKA
jgi:hypothetical protein